MMGLWVLRGHGGVLSRGLMRLDVTFKRSTLALGAKVEAGRPAGRVTASVQVRHGGGLTRAAVEEGRQERVAGDFCAPSLHGDGHCVCSLAPAPPPAYHLDCRNKKASSLRHHKQLTPILGIILSNVEVTLTRTDPLG